MAYCNFCGLKDPKCKCIKCSECSNSIGTCECEDCPVCEEDSGSCDCCMNCGNLYDDCKCCDSCGEASESGCDGCDYCTVCCSCDAEEEEEDEPAPKPRKGKLKMSTGQRVKQAVKSDAINASYRIAAKNLVKVIKKPLISALKSKGIQKPMVDMVANFLDTDLGSAIVSYIVGSGISAMPFLANNAKATRLAEECRIKGMETVGDAGMQFAFQMFGPVVSTLIDHINAQPELPGKKSERAALPMGYASFVASEEVSNTKASAKK